MAKKKHNQQWYKEQKAVAATLEKLGYRTRQQPGSGNRDITLQNDVVWHDSPIGQQEIECKWREKSLWKTLTDWLTKDGADMLTVKCHENRVGQDGERYVFMRWETFLQHVGSAADRSEHLADLPSVEPDKPWLTEWRGAPEALEEIERMVSDGAHHSGLMKDYGGRYATEEERRARIQAAHQNPPQRKLKPNKLKGRGFQK